MAIRSIISYSWNRNIPSETRDPFFSTLQNEMNRLLESFGPFPSPRWSSEMAPRLDVTETDKEIDVDAELPGIDEKDVEVTLSGDILTIRGERKNGREEKNKNYHLAERSYGTFTRSLTLPFDVQPNNVTATFDKGVLHVAIQKPESIAAKSAKIPVTSAS